MRDNATKAPHENLKKGDNRLFQLYKACLSVGWQRVANVACQCVVGGDVWL